MRSEKHRKRDADYQKQYAIDNPEKITARQAVKSAIARGDLVRGSCEVCVGGLATGNGETEAHHYLGYAEDHRLDVQWLCRKHHKAAHSSLRSEENPMTFSTSALSRSSGKVVKSTQSGPVQLTTNGHPIAVLVSQSDWDRIVRALNPPRPIEHLAEVASSIASSIVRGGDS